MKPLRRLVELQHLVGSSNLSKAAFSHNYEANVRSEISAVKFRRLCNGLDSVCEDSSPVSPDWVKHHYMEAKVGTGWQKGETVRKMGRSFRLANPNSYEPFFANH
jgi:hypothetical protein